MFHTVKIKVAIIFPNFPKRMVYSIHIPKATNIPWLLWPIS